MFFVNIRVACNIGLHILRSIMIHIGVGSDVVCSTTMGNARASESGTDNRTIPRFFMFITEFCLE